MSFCVREYKSAEVITMVLRHRTLKLGLLLFFYSLPVVVVSFVLYWARW
ncbi:MAG: hypothetical protein RMJ29_07210 [Candidatus Bipolaricaulota bacterium]|nr:hypothetical protein [Candidatus Bipolaricaulota bacterium]